jgi:GGDEF domain-containing protein
VARAQDAAICAQKLLEAMRLPYVIGEHDLHVTDSVGIAIYPDDGTMETLLDRANRAMHGAKDRGRNNYQLYRSDLNSRAFE